MAELIKPMAMLFAEAGAGRGAYCGDEVQFHHTIPIPVVGDKNFDAPLKYLKARNRQNIEGEVIASGASGLDAERLAAEPARAMLNNFTHNRRGAHAGADPARGLHLGEEATDTFIVKEQPHSGAESLPAVGSAARLDVCASTSP